MKEIEVVENAGDLGAPASGTGSHADAPSPDGLGPSGFDPSRVLVLARSSKVEDNPPDADRPTWVAAMLRYPEKVRYHAGNLAAHNWDVTEIDGRLLVCCPWSGGAWWDTNGDHSPLSEAEMDTFYPRVPYDTSAPEKLSAWYTAVHSPEGIGKPGCKRQRKFVLPCDRDASLAEDAQRLSPEGVAARAEGIAQ